MQPRTGAEGNLRVDRYSPVVLQLVYALAAGAHGVHHVRPVCFPFAAASAPARDLFLRLSALAVSLTSRPQQGRLSRHILEGCKNRRTPLSLRRPRLRNHGSVAALWSLNNPVCIGRTFRSGRRLRRHAGYAYHPPPRQLWACACCTGGSRGHV